MGSDSSQFAVVIVAAGRSERFGDPFQKKPFVSIQGKAVWLYSAEFFLNRSDVGQVVIVIAPEDQEYFRSQFGANLALLEIDVALGGETRAESVQRGIALTRDSFRWVAIHDAARPCLAAGWIENLFAAARRFGSVIPAIPVASTVKRSRDGQTIQETVDRRDLYLAQTPQVFPRKLLLETFAAAGSAARTCTDEAQLLEAAGHPVHIVAGSEANLKITTQTDLRLAQFWLQNERGVQRDAPPHPFSSDPLWR